MQTIDEFLDMWSSAERDGDADTLDRILTDDFVAVGPLGFVLPKPAWVGRYRGGGMHYDRFELDEVQTHVHERSAVVVARQNQDGSAQGHPVPEAARAMLVLSADGDDWRLAAVQLSFIAGTRGAPPVPGQGGR
jgi:ketosteroid isomerase-like protein